MRIVSAFFGRKNGTYPLTDIHSRNVLAGMITSFFSISSIPILVLEASANGNFTMDQTILWLFSIYVFGGLYSIVVPLYYRLPIVGAQTLTGIAFLTTVTDQFTYNELIGAFIFSGIFIVVVGYFGVFAKLVAYIPREVIAAMLAGMITKYMVGFIMSITELILIGIVALVAYFSFIKWVK